MDFTLADIARIADAKPRSCQLWADAGAIVAEQGTDRNGSGVHRRFNRTEVFIACVLQQFAYQKVSIGALLKVGAAIRTIIKDSHALTVFERAVRNEGVNVFLSRVKPTDDKIDVRLVSDLDGDEVFDEMNTYLLSSESTAKLASVLNLNTCLSKLRS